MFAWYRDAVVCFAYLEDVPTAADVHPRTDSSGAEFDARKLLSRSRWFTRGWTHQELLAPEVVEFYAQDWTEIGTKRSLAKRVSEITGIEVSAIVHGDLNQNVAQKLSWAAHRQTSRVEDIAYSLLGLFGVNMPLLYGEGNRAFLRLQEEIMKITNDYTLLAHGMFPRLDTHETTCCDALAHVPADFASAGYSYGDFEVEHDSHDGVFDRSNEHPPARTNRGLRVNLPIQHVSRNGDTILAYLYMSTKRKYTCQVFDYDVLSLHEDAAPDERVYVCMRLQRASSAALIDGKLYPGSVQFTRHPHLGDRSPHGRQSEIEHVQPLWNSSNHFEVVDKCRLGKFKSEWIYIRNILPPSRGINQSSSRNRSAATAFESRFRFNVTGALADQFEIEASWGLVSTSVSNQQAESRMSAPFKLAHLVLFKYANEVVFLLAFDHKGCQIIDKKDAPPAVWRRNPTQSTSSWSEIKDECSRNMAKHEAWHHRSDRFEAEFPMTKVSADIRRYGAQIHVSVQLGVLEPVNACFNSTSNGFDGQRRAFHLASMLRRPMLQAPSQDVVHSQVSRLRLRNVFAVKKMPSVLFINHRSARRFFYTWPIRFALQLP